MQAAEQKARHVRSDQTDETDGAGESRGRADQQGGGQDNLAAHPHDRHPEVRGMLLAELQSIKGPRIPPEENHSGSKKDKQNDHLGPLGRGATAKRPEGHGAQCIITR